MLPTPWVRALALLSRRTSWRVAAQPEGGDGRVGVPALDVELYPDVAAVLVRELANRHIVQNAIIDLFERDAVDRTAAQPDRVARKDQRDLPGFLQAQQLALIGRLDVLILIHHKQLVRC